jgi:hypothetical protein
MNIQRIGLRYLTTVATAALVFASGASKAEDIEVFVTPNLTGVTPNLIFSIDLSASMNRAPDGSSTTPTRLDILKQAMINVLNDSDLPDVNVGFTYFRSGTASGIKWPAAPLDADASLIDPNIPAGTTVREVLIGMLNATTASGITSTVESMYEFARYMRGWRPYYGLNDTFGTWNDTTMSYTGGTGGGDGNRAANRKAYSGSVHYVPLAHPTGTNYTCNDNTLRGGSDGCAGVRAAGAELSCNVITVEDRFVEERIIPAVPERICSATQCDSGCGTICTSYSEWQQPSSCITRNDGSLWVTYAPGGVPRQCCTSSDLGKTECITTRDYTRSCLASACNTGNARPYQPSSIEPAYNIPGYQYERCTYRRDDTRRYISPVTAQCQKTAFVLLSDGDPTNNDVDWGRLNSNGTARSPYLVRDMIAGSDPDYATRNDVRCDDYSLLFGGSTPWSKPYGNCAKELAEFMNTNPMRPAYDGSTVDTYAIGFGLTGPGSDRTWQYLQDITSAGGGAALEADDLSTLVDAFKTIIDAVSAESNTFSGYSTTLNTTTLTTANKAYMPMFNPQDDRSWDGNLKGYFLLDGEVKDINGNVATEIDASTGAVKFRATTQSFWSNMMDGNNALEGGVVGELTPSVRDIYVITDPAEVANVNLADAAHDLDTGNATLTPDVLGMASTATATEVADMIDWVRSARMGAPLHTKPLIIDYGSSTGEVLYFTTNQGFLHAIDVTGPSSVGDTNGGSEIFAFMPFEMVGTLAAQRADTMAGSHIYGLDGPLSSHIVDSNGNAKVDAAGERAFIYFGMRRGGTTYYAMDVTNPSAPRLAWKISAGQPGFEKLGQTWSRMTPATISDGGTPRSVLVFAGGYDAEKQDIPNTARDPAGDTVGMGVYVVDAMTGVLLNSFGADDPVTPTAEFMVDVPGMKYSMPADVRVEDSNFNGIADRLYMVDVGGQIWRADIEEGASISASSTIVPYLMADFSGISVADNRRFFYPPSVAIASRDGQAMTVLAVGSGYRAHPLNIATDDKFFVFFDSATEVGTPASVPPFLTMSSLYDATPNALQTATGAARDLEIAALGAANGWFIDLEGDQKVLVGSRIFDYKVFFNTFSSGVTDPCDYKQGVNRFFAVNLLDATAAIETDVDDDGEPDDIVRNIVIEDANSAIVSEPTIVTHAGDGAPTSAQPICSTVFAGSAPMMQICDAPVRVNWQTVR